MPILPIGPPRKTRSPGFTLLEILAVVFLLALISGLLSVRMRAALPGGVRLASRMIVGEVRRLRGMAAYTHKEQVLGLDINENRLYHLEPLAHGKSWEKTALPAGINLEDVVILSKGKIQGGEAKIRFFPNGCVDKALIHLRNKNNEAYTLEINPLTGQIKIHDKYIDQKT